MLYTISEICQAARSEIGDDLIPGGQVYTDQVLYPRLRRAHNELFRAMQKLQNPRIRRTAFYDLPPNTSVLDPITASIFSLKEIESIEQRGSVTSVNVTNAVPGTGIVTLTTTTHPFTTGQSLIVSAVGGLDDRVNGIFAVTIPSATSIILNGCTATGTYTSGGTVSFSAEDFLPVDRVQDFSEILAAPDDRLRKWYWQQDLIYFQPAATIRQLRIIFLMSGQIPAVTFNSLGAISQDATILIDDAEDFLALRTSALAMQSRQAQQRASELNVQAVGTAWESEGIAGGALGQLLDAGVRDLQALPQEALRTRAYRQWRGRDVW